MTEEEFNAKLNRLMDMCLTLKEQREEVNKLFEELRNAYWELSSAYVDATHPEHGEISKAWQSGYELGEDVGYERGKASGYEEGYSDGYYDASQNPSL